MKESSSAWVDDDDDAVQVDLNSTNRLRKLGKKLPASKVTGTQLSNLLHDRFQAAPLEWAEDVTQSVNIEEESGNYLIAMN